MRRNEREGFPKELYSISVAGLLFHLTGDIVQPIFALYVLDLGASLLQVGLFFSLQTVCVAIVRIPLTLLAARVGEGRMILAAFLIRSTAAVLYAVAPSYTYLYGIAVYEVVATGSFFQLILTNASNMTPPSKQGDAMGRFLTLVMMGMFIGPLITSAMISSISYSQLFVFSGMFSMAGLLLFLLITRRRRTEHSRNMSTPAIGGLPAISSLRTLVKDRDILLLSAIRTAYFVSYAMFTSFFAIYAVDQLKFSASMVAILFSVQGIVNSLVKLPVGKISDSFGKRKVLVITFAIIVLNYVGIARATDFASLLVLLAVFGACWGSRAVVEWSLLTSSVHQEVKTMAVSFVENFSFIGFTIGSAVAGLTVEVLPFSTIFLIAAMVNVLAIPCICALKPRS